MLDALNNLPKNYRGKSYLWNEKAVTILRTVTQKKVNGEPLNESIEETIDNFAAQASHTITGKYFVNGKYDSETIVLILLLENSEDFKSIMIESGQIASVCSAANKSRMKVLTSFVFAKHSKKN